MNPSTYLIQDESVVEKIQGVAFLVDTDGQQRVLQQGAIILPGQSIFVPAGSEVEMMQNGMVTVFNSSGISQNDVLADEGNSLDIDQILANAINGDGDGDTDDAPAAGETTTGGETQTTASTQAMSGIQVLAGAGYGTSADGLDTDSNEVDSVSISNITTETTVITETVNEAPEITITPVANDNMLINPSFEVNSNDSNNSKNSGLNMKADPTGWTSASGTIETWGEDGKVFSRNTDADEAADGSYIMELDQNKNSVDYIEQTVNTEDGETYTFTFSAMARVAGTSDINIYWNGVLVATTNTTDENTEYTDAIEAGYTVIDLGSLSEDEWSTFTLTLTADDSGTGTIRIEELESQDNSYGALLDNFSLVLVDISDSTNINETTTDDEVILTVSGTDTEDDAAGVALTYIVYTDASLTTVSDIFEIDADGNLTLVDGVDLTTLDTDSYDIYIVAVDSDGATSDAAEYTINIVRDAVEGTDSADTLYGGDSDDSIAGGEGDDTITGYEGEDNLYGEEGSDTLYGGEGNDNLYGGAGNDYLYGGEGNDILTGGEGDDYLSGGSGSDIFTWVQTVNDQSDTISDFTVDTSTSEIDQLDLSDLLQGYDAESSDIDDYLDITFSDSGDTVITVDTNGADTSDAATVTITLTGWSESDWESVLDTDVSADNLADLLTQNDIIIDG